jgi:hypothetical protein
MCPLCPIFFRWKHNHGLKAQTLAAPDGLCPIMWGLTSLRRSDSHIFDVSQINRATAQVRRTVYFRTCGARRK